MRWRYQRNNEGFAMALKLKDKGTVDRLDRPAKVLKSLLTKKFKGMAKNQTKRRRLNEVDKDTVSFNALKTVTGYTPSNPKYTVANTQIAYDNMVKLQAKEAQSEATFNSDRDNAIAAEWAFHNAILGSKVQVMAQFGDDSNEVQAMGLKKVSEYKRPSAKKTAAKTKQ
jgi:hypothetical protein